MSDLFDQEDIDLEDTTDGSDLLYELYFADGSVKQDEDGLVWKEVLREGSWAYRPGSGTKPVPVPLRVVAGHTNERGQIGMADLIDAFSDKAVDHVTVPTTHEDKPQDNTGYVKKLKIEGKNGKKRLLAGIEFTEPDIKDKAERGSIAGSSCGIMFDYIKKDSGKKYGQVLGHVALTNKPWINGMKPFGKLAEENYSEDEIIPLVLEEVVWDAEKSLGGLRGKVQKALQGTGYFVTDIQPNKALVNRFDEGTGGNGVNFVVPFQVRGGEVKIPAQDKWIEASQEWVKASFSELTKLMTSLQDQNFESQEELSEEAPTRGANVGDPETGGKNSMGSDTTKEKTPGATSDDPAPDSQEVTLSDEARKALKDELKQEFEETQANLSEENKTLRKTVHEMKVKERVTELEDAGFKQFPGFLAEIRTQMLADDGQPALVLSEQVEGSDETKEISLSVTDVIERIIKALPRTEDGTLRMSEQALEVENHSAPPLSPETSVDTNLSEEERIDNLAKGLGREELVKESTKKDGEN